MLIYGENIGLKESFKEKIISLFKDAEIVNLYNEDISKNKDIIINEAKNISLFTKSFISSIELIFSIFAIKGVFELTKFRFRGVLSAKKKFEYVRIFSKGSQ